MSNFFLAAASRSRITADLGKLGKRDACRPPHCSCAMIRGNVNWLLSAATVHEQRADNARTFLQVSYTAPPILHCFRRKQVPCKRGLRLNYDESK